MPDEVYVIVATIFHSTRNIAMKTERRPLNADESAQLSGLADGGIPLGELLWMGIGGGLTFGLIVAFVLLLPIRLIGLRTEELMGISETSFMWYVVTALALPYFAYIIHFEWKNTRRRRRLLIKIRRRDDFIVDIHDVCECKLVREPEHGGPMFFVRCADNSVIFVILGQDIDEEWEAAPFALPKQNRPRTTLKVIRHPATKDSILVEFKGDELPVRECFLIEASPSRWPSDGKLVRTPWEELDERFKLRRFDASTR